MSASVENTDEYEWLFTSRGIHTEKKGLSSLYLIHIIIIHGNSSSVHVINNAEHASHLIRS